MNDLSSAGRLGIQAFYLPKEAPPRPRVARGEGIWLIDEEGRRYLDASSGPVASNLGHSNLRVITAMKRQLDRTAFAFPLQFENEANFDLATRLKRLAGPGLERAFLVSGGSEANESAFKFLRQHAVLVRKEPSRHKIIGRQPGYHGNTLGALAVSGDTYAHEIFGPMLRATPRVPAPLTYRLPPNHTPASWARHCAAALEEAIVREGPETVLAFIMEPVIGLAAGASVAPDLYYGAVREICTRHGVKLIYDEVISGAGRTGRFLATDHWPEGRPDIVTLAKGVSAGYAPLGVLLAPETMAEELAAAGGFMHGFTYVANPLSCAAGAATLAEVEERDLVGNAARMGAVLRARLEALQAASPLIGDVRGRGLLMAIELVADKDSKRMIPLELMAPYRLQQLGYAHGLALYCRRTNRGADGDWLMISPPLIVSEAEIDTLVERLAAVLDQYAGELRGKGILA